MLKFLVRVARLNAPENKRVYSFLAEEKNTKKCVCVCVNAPARTYHPRQKWEREAVTRGDVNASYNVEKRPPRGEIDESRCVDCNTDPAGAFNAFENDPAERGERKARERGDAHTQG